jgi:hypothetical protein
MNMTRFIVLGIVAVLGCITLVILKIVWSKQAAKKWAANEAARDGKPRP